MKNKFLSLALLFFPGIFFAQGNLNISNSGPGDTEPYIAVNPLNPNFIIAAWMKITFAPPVSIAVSCSSDGGVTWSTPYTMPHLHNNFTQADVSIAYNGSGTAYICYIDYDPSFDSGYVMVAGSVNNGLSWSTPVKVISGLETPDLPVDRPWIAVDRSGGPYNGKIYVVTKSAQAGQLPHHIWMKSSSDGGLTWSSRLQIDNPSGVGFITNSMGSVDVGPDGKVFVAYMSHDTSQSPLPRMLLKKSADGGNTFSQSVIGYPVSGSQVTDSLYQGSYCLKVNLANANNLVFIVTDARYGDPDILAVRSTDGGATWNFTPVRVNDDLQNNGIGQDMCWGAFSPNGIFCAVWRDRRNGGSGSSASFEIYASASTDGGATFKPDFRISSQSSPVIPIVRGNDFLGVAMDNNFLFTDWCDKRTGNTEIFTAKDSLAGLVAVNEKDKQPFEITCFPNPASSEISFVITTGKEVKASLAIYDMQGRLVQKFYSGNLSPGINKFNFNIAMLASGDYVLKVHTASGSCEKLFTRAK